ncbi:MAG: LamG-like jellyroll fold domain-containing protein [Planctomycetota bacterium]|jgi:N-acetylneuraminic acid mutarotase
MKKTFSMVLVLALAVASVSLALEDTWTRKADMPTGRCTFSTGVVNGRIYAIGGAKGRTEVLRSVPLEIVEEYHPATDTWMRKADMPTARNALSVSVVDGKIYAIGGAEGIGAPLRTVEEYDPATDTWTNKADMPTARFALSTSTVNGKTYAIGGSMGGFRALSIVEEYDPVTNIWTRKADIPTARIHLSTSVVDGKIYAFGGTAGAPSYASLRTVEEYDPMTDSWKRKANMPVAGCTLCTSVVNGKIYAIGGATPVPAVAPLSNVREYDPATDTWIDKSDMPTARSGLSTSAVNGKIYAIGGLGNPMAAALSIVEEYDTGLIVSSPDFNGDGIVDSADMCIMVDHWHTDYPLCDIAPAPFGDGIVDVQDLIVLSEHLFEDYRLVAHWALDETEGDIAYDSAGDKPDILNGNPIWQPAGGMYDGALEFDGNDDYISTPFVLNPGEKSFSAFVWIRGGAPGQVIISQSDITGDRRPIPGCAWLGINPSNGNLMTGLMETAFGPLETDSIITDGHWHHIGLVYDLVTMRRHLYLDGAEVAADTDFIGGVQTTGGLYIGAGQALDASSFFSGLIDDVRIYDIALSPEEIETLSQ